MTNIYIALKFLIKNLVQTLITIFIVAIGTAIFYFVFNSSASLKRLVLTSTADATSHIYLNGNFPFTSYEDEQVIEFEKSIYKKDKRVTTISYSQYLNGSVKTVTDETLRLTLKGLDFDKGKTISNIDYRIQEGKLNRYPENGPFTAYSGEVIIGDKLASQLGYNNFEDAVGGVFKYYYNGTSYNLKIVATYYSDFLDISLHTVFTTLDVSMLISNNYSSVNAIEIKTKNPLKSDQVLANIKDTIISTYPNSTPVDWQEGNKYAVNALYIEDVSIFIIQFITAVAIAFGINSLILFNIRQKLNQVGILMAMGTKKKDITLVFLYQIILIVVLGIIIGIYGGHLFSLLFMKIFKRPDAPFPLIKLYDNLFNKYTLISALIIFTSSIIFSIGPVKYMQKLKVAEVIKYE